MFCPCTDSFDCGFPEICQAGACRAATTPEDDADAGNEDESEDLIEDSAPDEAEVDSVEDSDLIDTESDEAGEEPDVEEEPDIEEEPEAPSCADDERDSGARPDDSASRAGVLEVDVDEEVLIICPDDEDWFEITIPAHHIATVTVREVSFEPMELTLFDEDGTTELASGEVVRGGTAAEYEVFGSTVVLARVRPREALFVSEDYAIQVTTERVACDDDPYDVGDGNDTHEFARSITDGTYNLVFCGYEEEADWFAFSAVPGTDLEVTLDFDEEAIGGELDVALFRASDPSRTYRAGSFVGDTKIISVATLDAGNWFLAVDTRDDVEGAYSLGVTRTSSADCGAFDVFHEDDGTEVLARSPEMILEFDSDGSLIDEDAETVANLVMCEGDTADILAFELQARERLSISVVQDDAADPLRVVVYPQGTSPESVTPISIDGNTFQTTFSATNGGVHYLRIEPGPLSARNTYHVSMSRSTCEFDLFEPNDSPDDAYEFELGSVAFDVNFCPFEDTTDWFVTRVNPYRLQRIRVDNPDDLNLGENSLDVTLFEAEPVAKVEWCQEASDCEPSEVCLGRRGCAVPVIGRTRIPAGSFGELEYETDSEGGEFLMRVQLANNLSPTTYLFNWSDPDSVCPADRFGENHSDEDTYPIRFPDDYPLRAALCDPPGERVEDDYFEIELEEGDEITIVATFDPGNRVRIELPCGGDSDTVSDSGVVSYNHVALADGTVCFAVKGLPESPLIAAFEYDLTVTKWDSSGVCSEDPAEENDELASPYLFNEGEPWVDAFVQQSLSICGDDPDFFQITAQAGDQLVAHAAFASADDLTLTLYGPCAPGACVELASGESEANGIGFDFVVEELGNYRVGVVPAAADSEIQYELAVGILGGCTPDSYEPNETASEASSVTGSEDSLSICAADKYEPDFDWFRYHLHPGDQLAVSAEFERYHGEISLGLWAGEDLVLEGTPTEAGQILTYDVAEPGDLDLEVYSPTGGRNSYSLNVEMDVSACPEDMFEPNDDRDRAIPIQSGPYRGLSHCHHGEDWFRVEQNTAGSLAVALTAYPGTAGDDVIFELYGPDAGASTEAIYRAAAGSLVDVTSVEAEPGSYLIRVFQRAGTEISGPFAYDLEVFQAPAGGCAIDLLEENDTSEEAIRISGDSSVVGSTCGNEDWFLAHLFIGQSLSVELSAFGVSEGDSSPAITLETSDGTVGTSFNQLAYTAVVPTDVWIKVHSDDASIYLLSLATTSATDVCVVDPDEPNNSIEQARLYSEPFQGRLCDAIDVFEIQNTINEDSRARLFYDASSGTPELEITTVGELVIGSGMPVSPGLLDGWFTWGGGGSTFAHIRANSEYSGPYLLEVEQTGVCAPDFAESNDSANNAYTLTLGETASNLTLCHNDDIDFFNIEAESGERVVAKAWVNRDDIALHLFDPSGNLIAASNSSTVERPKESVWAIASESGTFTAAVSSPIRQTTDYDIFLNAESDTDPCEEEDANQSMDTALPLPNALTRNLQACPGLGDWYVTETVLAPDQVLQATVLVTSDRWEDLDIEIYDPSGNLVGWNYVLGRSDNALAEAPAEGQYFIRVFVADGTPAIDYSLIIQVL